MIWQEQNQLILHFAYRQQVDGSTAADSKLYHNIVGALVALQYIILTRLDLSFSINKLSQFIHKSTQINFQQLKRAMMYPKLAINHGFKLKKLSHIVICNYIPLVTLIGEATWMIIPPPPQSISSS